MRTAYEALHRAIIKDFGKWYSFEWKAVANEVKPRIQSGELASKHWNSIFLPDLDNLCVGYRAFGEFFINGNLSNSADFGMTQGANIELLKSLQCSCRYWVFSSYSFDDNFSLRGFRTKSEAIECWKSQMRRADDLFYTFWYRW